MSQSAVSDALSRLRRIFQDDLLIPSRRGFELSETAVVLQPMVEESLRQVEILLNARPFDFRQASGRVRIAASDYATFMLGPALVRRLHESAPAISIQFHDVDEESAQALNNGELDFILMPEAALSVAELQLERVLLFEDELTLIASTRAGSRENDGAATVWAEPETLLHPSMDSNDMVGAVVRQHLGKEGTETIVLPGFMLLPFFVENTNITAVAQRRLAERLMPAAKIRTITPSFPFTKIRMLAAWSRSRTADPLHRWLRDLLVEIGAEITGQSDHYA
jgi:DNA-binding transcriptional LysR family regulator